MYDAVGALDSWSCKAIFGACLGLPIVSPLRTNTAAPKSVLDVGACPFLLVWPNTNASRKPPTRPTPSTTSRRSSCHDVEEWVLVPALLHTHGFRNKSSSQTHFNTLRIAVLNDHPETSCSEHCHNIEAVDTCTYVRVHGT